MQVINEISVVVFLETIYQIVCTLWLTYGLILHQDSISFHLSHQPPLYVLCRALAIRMGLFTS